MGADTPVSVELNLPQAVLLLATNDTDGRPEVPVFALRTAVAGAVLAELHLLGAVELQGKHVRATGRVPMTDFQHELEVIRDKSRPHTPKRWVAMFEGRAQVQRVYEGMASLGILEPIGEGRAGRFRARRYAEKDHAPRAALLNEIEQALGGTPSPAVASDSSGVGAEAGMGAGAGATEAHTADHGKAAAAQARVTALIALLEASGLLARLLPAADKTWADEIAKDYWPARAVEDELRLIRIAEEEAPTL
ncbi:GOLPH3/VPS74 family protein [Sinomonas halotolerans]|uniref:GPP34 family phosphoprotein n=1 Tax=Sinomonas halotolerans TaxID=1644133 RepID=A0ABU9X4I7_9MICC